MDDIWTEALDEAERSEYGYRTVPASCACCKNAGLIGLKWKHCSVRGGNVPGDWVCDEFEEA